MNISITDTELKAFISHVKGIPFELPHVAEALNLEEDRSLEIFMPLIESKILDVTVPGCPVAFAELNHDGNLALIQNGLDLFQGFLQEIQNLPIAELKIDFFENSDSAMKILLEELYIFLYQDEIELEVRRKIALQKVMGLFEEGIGWPYVMKTLPIWMWKIISVGQTRSVIFWLT